MTENAIRKHHGEADLRRQQEETFANEHQNSLPLHPDHARTAGIFGAICIVFGLLLLAVQFL